MRHTAPVRRLLSIFLTALIVFPNLLIAPVSASASQQQAQVNLYGYVKNQFGAPISGAQVVLSGDAAGTINTDGNGYFSFTVPASCGVSYELKAFVNGTQAGVTSTASGCVTADRVYHFFYEAPYNVTLDGYVRNNLNAGVPGVTVTLSGDSSQTTLTDANGHYTFSVPAGCDKTYHVEITRLDGSPGYSQSIGGCINSDRTFSPFNYTPPAPTNGKIAFSSYRDGNNGEIYTTNADGTGITRLTFNAGVDFTPVWSPDGTRIAFISNRDADGNQVYVMDADGANVTKVTNTSGVYYKPNWSPDGTRLIFTSYQNSSPTNPQSIYVVDRDGGNLTQISNTDDFFDPAYSPDGTKIAARLEVGANHTPDIFVMNADGSNPVNITNSPNLRDHDPTWSYDGQRIVFRSQDEFGRYEIFTMNPDGSNKTQLTQSSQDNNFAPRWSPDAQKVVFQSHRDGNSEIYTMNADGTGQTRITNDPAEDVDASWQQQPPASPAPPAPIPTPTPASAGRIVFVAPIGSTTELFAMNADGSNRVRLTNDSSFENFPAVSPDGSKIAFSANRSSFNIWVMNADGSNPVQLTHDQSSISDPVWSPDGTRIAFPAHRGSPGIYVMNADGSNQHKIENGMSGGGKPSWSPDGQKIAFVNYDGATNNIYSMNVDGTNLVKLTNTPAPGSSGEPAWSPDGTKIAFSSIRNGLNFSDIYLMNADGSNQTRLTASLASGDEAPSWSPDGKQLTYWIHRDHTSQVWRMHANGSYQTRLDFGSMPSWGPVPANPTPTPTPTPTQTPTPTPTPTPTTTPTPTPTPQPTPTPTPTPTPQPTPTPTPEPTPSPTPQPTPTAPPMPATDMSVSVGADKRNVDSGTEVVYSIYVANYGPASTTGVTLDIELPPGLALYNLDNVGCSGSTDENGVTPLSCTFYIDPTFAPGETRIVTMTTRATGAPYTRFHSTFTVGSNAPDPYTDNNETNHDLFISGPPVPVPTPATGWNALLAYETRRDGNTEIYTRRADGTEQMNVTHSPQDDPSQHGEYAWSPDGQKIAFTRYVEVDENNSEVFVMNADGSNVVQVSNTPDARDTMPIWSPDGTKIVFASRSNLDQAGSIHVVDAGGTSSATFPNSAREIDDWPSWSPDSQSVVFSRGRYDEEFNYLGSQIYVADASGGNQTQLTTPNAATADHQPAWSPDGTTVAFLRNTFESNGDSHPSDLYVMNADGSNVRNLSNDAQDNLNFSWSPDGSRIAYSCGNTGDSTLYVVAVGNGNLIYIDSSSNRASVPAWSPDGTRLTYDRVLTVQNYNAANVYIANADGSGARIVGGDFEYNQYPVWSPDGKHIAFRTLRGGGGIDIINADGTGRVDLTNDPGYYTHPKWQPVMPPPSADLSIYAWTEPTYVSSNGGQFSYFVSVFNNGPDAATNVTITGQMPAGVTLNSVVNDNGDGSTCAGAPDGASFSCTFPAVDLYHSKLVSLHATSNAVGAPNTPVTANFSVTSDTSDPEPFSNTTAADFFIPVPPLPTPTPGPANDGEIAYEAESGGAPTEILLRRADGTGAVNLSNDPAYDGSFVWSPDGNRMAFIRTAYTENGAVSDIYVVNADGTNPLRVTDTPNLYENRLAWSPDGTRLAYDASPDGNLSEVFVTNADGTGNTRVSTPGHMAYQPEWSPDGTRLAFTRTVNDGTLGFSAFTYVVEADGSNLTKFEHDHSARDFHPAWSPDGTRLAFARGVTNPDGTFTTDIYTANPDGSNLLNVSHDGVSTDKPIWSPDGTRLFFSSFENNFFAFVTMKADGTNRTVLYNPTNGSYGAGVAAWSPDGSKIVFDYILSDYTRAGVYVVNADGTGLVALGDELEFNSVPDWSPDSRRVVFTTFRNGTNALNVINADGTNRVQLPLDADYYYTPKWRPRAVPQNNTPAGSNVAVNTESGVQLSFSNVTQAGQTTVTPIDPNSLQGIPGEYIINANSLAFEITTTATYSGPITIGFNVPGITNPITFSTLRVLHGEPPPVPNFVDRTILAPDAPSHDFPTRTIYARVSSLSPFVVVERADGDGVAPDISIASPAADAVYLLRQTVVASYACADAGSGVASCVGTKASGAALNTGAVGSYNFVVNASDHAGNTSTRSVSYRVAYGVKPLYDQTKAHKSGSTIPIKLELTDAAHVNQSASDIVVTALTVTRISDNAPGVLSDPGDSNPDFNFRYAGGQYHFNLKASGYSTGTYLLSFKAGNDPTTHTVQFQVK